MPWRSRWSSARLSSTPASGAKRSVSSSWNDDASHTTTVASGRPEPTSDVSAVPTFPTTTAGRSAVRWRCPISSTVVVFPFDPVTAIVSFGTSRQPSSSSPSTPIPASRAATITGASFGTPGLLISVSTPASSSTPGEPEWTATPAASSSRRRPSGTSPESTPTTSAPSDAQRTPHRDPGAGQAHDEVRPRGQRRAREHAGDCVGRSGGIPEGTGPKGTGTDRPDGDHLGRAGAVGRPSGRSSGGRRLGLARLRAEAGGPGRPGRPRTRGPPPRGGGGLRPGRRGRCRRSCRRS